MPDSLFAVAVLVVAVIPGFLFLQGYNRGRAHAAAPDIFVIAKAALASLVFVTFAWVLPELWAVESGATVLDWVRDKKFDEHRDYFLGLAWGVFSLSFLSGLGIGWTVDRLGRAETGISGALGAVLRWMGFVQSRTLWAKLLEDELQEPKLFVVRLAEGQSVIGVFDEQSVATPDLAEVYLSETYVLDEAEDALVPQNRALYLKGSDVRSIAIGPIP